MKSDDDNDTKYATPEDDVGLDGPLPFDPYDETSDPIHPDKVWVLLDSTDLPNSGHDYATPEEMLGRHAAQRNQQVRDAVPAKPVRPMPTHWVGLEAAADVLGEESPDALRKKLARVAVRAADGVTEAHINGIVGRKLGKLWKVKLSAEWQGERSTSRGGRR